MIRVETRLHSELVPLLRLPKIYPERPASVELLETPASWLFFTNRYVYKLKKPLFSDSFDLRTADRRRHACQQEVKLNRRLAPGVYLGVVPIARESSGAVKVDGAGPVIDWVVKMRRLPAERSLTHLIQQGIATGRDVADIARVVADFYTLRPPLCIRPDAHRQYLAQRVKNCAQTLADVGRKSWAPDVQSVYAALQRFLALFADVLDRRVCDGRIVDGHGDLHTDHVYLEAPPVIIDCVECHDTLRRLDIVDELASLDIECDRLGAAWIGEQVFDAYRHVSRDDPPKVLWDFYRGYRAVARASAAAAHVAQLPSAAHTQARATVRDYIRLARHYLDTLSAPTLVVVTGLMGTGKSTLAGQLGQLLGIEWLSIDDIACDGIVGNDARTASDSGFYRGDMRESVYSRLLQRAGRLLRKGQSVVIDGTFLSRHSRERAIQLAGKHDAAPLLVVCSCPRRAALARIERRLAEQPANFERRPELYEQQSREQEPLDEGVPTVEVDTTAALNLQLDCVACRLRAELFPNVPLAAPDGS